jgi:hypothetical protein
VLVIITQVAAAAADLVVRRLVQVAQVVVLTVVLQLVQRELLTQVVAQVVQVQDCLVQVLMAAQVLS